MAQANTEYLAVMQLDNVELLARSQELTRTGKLIRKEIMRRKKCGNHWQGPYQTWNLGSEVIETPSTVGTVRTYTKGSR
tara:strand:- start:484 stop:720 length:237 start_codon:yes stop_codon:yes gene_type:complete